MNKELIRKGFEKISIEALDIISNIDVKNSTTPFDDKVLLLFTSQIGIIYNYLSFLSGCLDEIGNPPNEQEIEYLYEKIKSRGLIY